MDWDHLAEKKSQDLFAAWLQLLSKQCPDLPLKLAGQCRPKAPAVNASGFITGAYNICCIVTFEDGVRVVVRFPILGRSRFRTEKTRDEISMLRFLRRKTKLPVPIVLGAGRWGCGPYIVTTYIEGTPLSKSLGDRDVGNPILEKVYYGMTQVILEFSKPIFRSAGTLELVSESWMVAKRPLTLNMNEMLRVGNLPPDIFRQSRFETAAEYFLELANQQLLHLQHQRNDAVENEDDCRKKYISRCLSRKIAQEIETQPGPYHLYCDDLGPSNVLVSDPDLTVTGVIDLEFTYVAPVEFTRVAPWWLLFESPEAWDLDTFLAQYRPRLEVFLRVLRACEDEFIQMGKLKILNACLIQWRDP